jgi:amino acid adenylation domain-containing protein
MPLNSYPLSTSQEAIWLFEITHPHSCVYNIPIAYDIRGGLRESALRDALDRLVAEHEIMRTVYREEEGRPVQVVLPAASLPLSVEDLCTHTSKDRMAAALSGALTEAQRSFELSSELPIRARLWRLDEQHHILQLTIHHIASDGWSRRLIEHQLWGDYESLTSGTVPPSRGVDSYVSSGPGLSNMETPAERARTQEANVVFWTETLAGLPTGIPLPWDHTRPAVESHRGSVSHHTISADATQQFAQLCRHTQVSLFDGLVAATQSYLLRCADLDEGMIGFLDAHRDPDTIETLGNFVNALPLRSQLGEQDTFRDVLMRAHVNATAALEHGDMPFADIVRTVHAPRDNGRNPIFQFLLVFEPARTDRAPVGLQIRPFMADEQKSKFDMTLFAMPEANGLALALEYATDLFDPTTAERFLIGLDAFLAAALQEPDRRVLDLPVLSDADRSQLACWNQTARDYDLNSCVSDAIEDTIAAAAQRTAIIADTGTGTIRMTYRELGDWADELARRLLAAGVARGDLVAVLAPRSPGMVAALVAVGKAGGTFVPIDAEYPDRRITQILHDADPKVVLCAEGLAARVGSGSRIVSTARDPEPDGTSHAGAPVRMPPADHAYVVYTSGSTGKPKGAINTERAFRNRLVWMQEQFGLTAEDRVLHKTPIGFDVALWEVFWPLCTGASIVLARPGGQHDPKYLVGLMADNRVTVTHFVPSMLRPVLDCLQRSVRRPQPRLVICSGEALPRDLAIRHRSVFDRTALFNLYGPSEAAIDVTCWDTDDGAAADAPMPIGRPIANTRIFILDSRHRPAPIGWPGEIAIGGVAVGAGYLNRPELTEEHFRSVNMGGSVGPEWVYLTGDRGRFRSDGVIEFFGRRDEQVKIHGQRVELGEIESALRGCAGVGDSAVIFEHGQLIAYVVLAAPVPQSGPDSWRAELRAALPEYMVPRLFVTIPELPRTANGKIARAALPPVPWPDSARATADQEPERSGWTDRERKLADIWSRIVGVANFGLDDSFFDIGGDSIRAIDVAYRAGEAGLVLGVADVLAEPTLRGLAARAGRAIGQGGPVEVEPFAFLTQADRALLPSDAVDAYPLTMLQAGLAYHSERGEGYAFYVSSLRIDTEFEENALRVALRQVTATHPMMRTSFHLTGFSTPMQIVHRYVEPWLVCMDWPDPDPDPAAAQFTAWMAEQRAQLPDWPTAPLLRFFAAVLPGGRSFQLTVVEPFLDGFSVATLLTDVLVAYSAALRGGQSGPAEEEHGFREYYGLEKTALNSAEDREYWDSVVADAPFSALPRWPLVDHAQPGRHIRRKIVIDPQTAERLQEIAHSMNVPLKSVLLAAHLVATGLLSGQRDVVTGVLFNGRPENRGGRRAIGLFLNALPLRADVGNGSVSDLIRAVYEAETRSYPHRRYPLAQIMREHDGPIFDSLFNFVHFHPYQEAVDAGIQISDIRATDQTYFFLTAQFAVGWNSDELSLSLDVNAGHIPESEVGALLDYYLQVLADVVNDG